MKKYVSGCPTCTMPNSVGLQNNGAMWKYDKPCVYFNGDGKGEMFNIHRSQETDKLILARLWARPTRLDPSGKSRTTW